MILITKKRELSSLFKLVFFGWTGFNSKQSVKWAESNNRC